VFRTRFTEHTVLFFSILKWVALATVIGLIVGSATSGFLLLLRWGIDSAHRFDYYFLLLPVAMFFSVLLTKYLAPDAEGHGTEKVIEAIHKHSGRIKPAVVPVKLAATLITLAAGGSVGKEGPCAQIGAGLASLFADIFRFSDEDRRKLVICGISAGFAAVFGTPIGGSIFGVEVLYAGTILYDVLLPSFVAGIVGYHIAAYFGITYFYFPVKIIPVFSEAFFLKAVLIGLFIGLCASLLIETLTWGHKLSKRLRIWEPLKGLGGGVLLVGLAFAISTKYLGLGLDTIEATLSGTNPPWYAFLAKILFTGITLSFGGSGGIVTPIFFIGATAGALFATWLSLDVATFSAIGLVSMLAGAANTPIAASIMSIELFGPALAPYATVACVISFLMTGHRSVYSSQILSMRKSPAFDVELGGELQHTNATYNSRHKFPWGRASKDSAGNTPEQR
jgi:H+/Cl- antiporter ClcA